MNDIKHQERQGEEKGYGMKLKVQGKKRREKVENEKKIAGEDKTGNMIFFRYRKNKRSERRQQVL